MSIHRHVLQVSLPFLLSCSALACLHGSAPPIGSGGAGGSPSEESGGGPTLVLDLDPAPADSPPPSRALAATNDGAIALISGETGAQIAATAPGDREVRSIAFDPTAGLVLEAVYGDIDSGELVGFPITGDPPVFGEPIALALIDGDVRLLGTPEGVVTFAKSFPASTWSWSGGASSASPVLPPPVSVWIAGGTPEDTVRIEALTLGQAGAIAPVATRQAAIATRAGLAPEPAAPLSTPIGAPIEDPTTARLVAIPAVGDALLIDVEGGVVATRRVDGAIAGEPVAVPGAIAAARVEAAVPLSGGRVVVAATSGPARLVAIAIDDAGAPVAGAAIDLPGGFAVADRFFSSDLLAIADDRVLVATGTGVLAVDVIAPDGAIALAIDPAFDGAALRGPLATSP